MGHIRSGVGGSVQSWEDFFKLAFEALEKTIPHLFEPLQNILPSPVVTSHQIGPSLIIFLGTPSPYTEIYGGTAPQAFPSTTIDLPFPKIFLGNATVTPIVTISILERPVPFAKSLMARIRIGAASVQQENFVMG